MLTHDEIGFHNVAALEPADGGGLYLRRFPQSVRQSLSPLGQMVSQESAGAEIRFVTEAKSFRLSIGSRPNILSPWETHLQDIIIFRGAFFHSHYRIDPGRQNQINVVNIPGIEKFDEIQDAQRSGCGFSANVWRIFCGRFPAIYFNLDTYGFARRPPLPAELPSLRWLAYGSSITHGGAATVHHQAYIYHAARSANLDVLNQGLSGSCLCESTVADYFASRSDWHIATLELGVNMRDKFTPAEFRTRAEHLLQSMLKDHPNRPIALITIYPNSATAGFASAPAATTTECEAAFNKVLRELARQYARPNLYLIEGSTILTDFAGLSADLIHPSDYGHALMGANLGACLNRIITKGAST